MRKIISLLVVLFIVFSFVSCTDAMMVRGNLANEADMFRVYRRVVFYNGITDTYILTVEGYCSIYDDGNQLELTGKTGPDNYKKHFLGLSDNVTYFAEQLESKNVSEYHYKEIFKPSAIIPDIEIK